MLRCTPPEWAVLDSFLKKVIMCVVFIRKEYLMMEWDFTLANYGAVWSIMVQLGLLLLFLLVGNILRRTIPLFRKCLVPPALLGGALQGGCYMLQAFVGLGITIVLFLLAFAAGSLLNACIACGIFFVLWAVYTVYLFRRSIFKKKYAGKPAPVWQEEKK